MDIHLPVLSGVAAATLIKIHNPFVSIIALTAGDPNEDEKSMVMADVFSVTADTIQSHLEKLSQSFGILRFETISFRAGFMKLRKSKARRAIRCQTTQPWSNLGCSMKNSVLLNSADAPEAKPPISDIK
jgi:CheY-like chemotaxis protein